MAGFPISILDPTQVSDTSGVGDLLSVLLGLGTGGIGGVLGGLGLDVLGPLLGSLFGGGVPTGAKTSGAAQALQGEGGVAADLGAGIGALGGGRGSNVLSNPAFAHDTNTLADALTWLSGSALPGYKTMGTTGEIANIPAPSGAPYSGGVNIMGVQSPQQLIAQLGKSPNLSPAQIQAMLPQLEKLANTPGMSVAGLKSALGPLIAGAGTPSGVGNVQDYLNQPGTPGGSSTSETAGGGANLTNLLPLLNLFGLGGLSNSNSDTTNNSTTNNLMGALTGGGGFGVAYKPPTFAIPSPLPTV